MPQPKEAGFFHKYYVAPLVVTIVGGLVVAALIFFGSGWGESKKESFPAAVGGTTTPPAAVTADQRSLIGTWIKDDDRLVFGSGGTVIREGPLLHLPPARYTLDNNKLAIHAQGGTGTFVVDFVSELELILVPDGIFAQNSALGGSWKKQVGGKAPTSESPSVKSPPASTAVPVPVSDEWKKKNPKDLIVGKWENTTKNGNALCFTSGGTLLITSTFRSFVPGRETDTYTTDCKYKFIDNYTLETTARPLTPTGKNYVVKVNIEFLSRDEFVITGHADYNGNYKRAN